MRFAYVAEATYAKNFCNSALSFNSGKRWLRRSYSCPDPHAYAKNRSGAPLFFSDVDHSIFQSIELPSRDRFGVMMRKDDSLAKRKEFRFSDLHGIPLIVSRAALGGVYNASCVFLLRQRRPVPSLHRLPVSIIPKSPPFGELF